MRAFTVCLALGLLTIGVGPVLAQPGGPGQSSGRRPDARQRALRQFDRNQDGQLGPREFQAAQRQFGQAFAQPQPGDEQGESGPRPRGRGGRGGFGGEAGFGPRGEGGFGRGGFGPGFGEGFGPPGGGGPPGAATPPPQDVVGLFDWYDTNSDGTLSRDEFTELSRQIQRREAAGNQGPRGPRAGRGPRGEGGPPGPGGRGRGGRGRRGGRGGAGADEGEFTPPAESTPLEPSSVGGA